MDVPAGQTQLVVPTTPPSYILLGVGVQNYTCSSAGTYTLVMPPALQRPNLLPYVLINRGAGAVAELFDISCVKPANIGSIQDRAFDLWTGAPARSAAARSVSCLNLPDVGQHYFIPTPSGGTAPKWDFSSTGTLRGNKDAYVVAAKAGGIVAPTGPGDVDWLSLNAVEGKLASQV